MSQFYELALILNHSLHYYLECSNIATTLRTSEEFAGDK